MSRYSNINFVLISPEELKLPSYVKKEVLAKNNSLVSDSVSYYLEQKKNNISIHDEEIYAYLKTQYADIFVD